MEEDVYSKSYEEVYEIIKLMPSELSDKIPLKFKRMLENKRSKNYRIVLNSLDEVKKAHLRPETLIILGLIYKDFLAA